MGNWSNKSPLARSQRELEQVMRTALGVVLLDDYVNGDGSDESVNLQQALTDAGAAKVIWGRADKTYTCASTISVPDGSTWFGNGCIVRAAFSIGSNTYLRDLEFGDVGKRNTFRNNTDGVLLENCSAYGGDAAACVYLNDSKVTNVTWLGGAIYGNVNGGNGVQIVDKGTVLKHYEDINFERVHFYGNDRMQFECIQRADVGNPIVSGYLNINHTKCRFDGTPGQITVSYDSGVLADGTNRSSGNSTLKRCKINGGTYGLEIAGAIGIKMIGGSIQDSTTNLVSMSQFSTLERAKARFIGVTMTGTGNIVLAGRSNVYVGNDTTTSGSLRLAACSYSLIGTNDVECTGLTAVSVENSPFNNFTGNQVRGGTNQTFLFIYTGTTFNRVDGNVIFHVNAPFDIRDGTTQHIGKNTRIFGANTYSTETGGINVSTPGAVSTVSIPHSLGTNPTRYNVTPGDLNARGAPLFYVSFTTTNLVLNFATPLAAATPYTWAWTAGAW